MIARALPPSFQPVADEPIFCDSCAAWPGDESHWNLAEVEMSTRYHGKVIHLFLCRTHATELAQQLTECVEMVDGGELWREGAKK